MKIEAVVFDLDGTLIESRPAIAASINHARRTHGHSELAQEEVARRIGWGLDRLLGELFPGDEIEDVKKTYRSHYKETCVAASHVLPGVTALLGDLRDRGRGLGLATNKPAYFAHQLLEGLELSTFISEVVGSGDVPDQKPHPGMLELAIDRLGASPETSLYVGDMHIDVETAARAGVRFVGVATGAETREQLVSAGAARVVAGFDELKRLLDNEIEADEPC